MTTRKEQVWPEQGRFAEDGIFALPERIARLAGREREIAERILVVQSYPARVAVTEQMNGVVGAFGGAEEVARQRIIRITNKVTHHGALFNKIRGRRPMHETYVDLKELIAQRAKMSPFADPEAHTPPSSWGRIETEHSITADNIAKYDDHSGLVIFKVADPLGQSKEAVFDHLMVAAAWWRLSYEADVERYHKHHKQAPAAFPFMTWNGLWKGAASQTWGHLQTLLARGRHYDEVEAIKDSSVLYKKKHQGDNFFADYMKLHDSLGLLVAKGDVAVMAHLAPSKEGEILVFAPSFDENLASIIADLYDCYISQMGVRSFTIAVACPPLDKGIDGWSEFPVVVRLLDRGNPLHDVSDISGMEMFGTPIVATNPYSIVKSLRQY